MCLAVALWGTSYKIEQYPQQGRAFRVMAPAKLLTERERPRRLGGLHRVLTSLVAQWPHPWHLPAGFACDHQSALQAHPSGVLVLSGRRPRIVLPELTFFSFRPPPPRFTS